MAGKRFSKKHLLLPNQIAYGGHQMKADVTGMCNGGVSPYT